MPSNIQTSATGVQTKRDSITYNDYGRVLIKTNELDHTVLYTYDPLTGKNSSTTDHLGNTAYNEYNNWGELVKTISPLGLENNSTVGW